METAREASVGSEALTSALIDERHLMLLKDAIGSTFETICGSAPEYVESPSGGEDPTGVLGIIAVIGDLSWSLSLGFSRNTAERVARQFAGFEIPFDSPDMNDVIGELANVLAGDVVARLEAAGLGVKMSLPTVTRGDGIHVTQPGAVSETRMRFDLPQGTMWLGLGIAGSSRA